MVKGHTLAFNFLKPSVSPKCVLFIFYLHKKGCRKERVSNLYLNLLILTLVQRSIISDSRGGKEEQNK